MTASLIQSFTVGQTIQFSALSYNGPNWLTEFWVTQTQHAIHQSVLCGAVEDLTRSHQRKYCWCSVQQARQLEAHALASSQARWGCHAYWQMVEQHISMLHKKASGAVIAAHQETNAHVLFVLKDTRNCTKSSFDWGPSAAQPPQQCRDKTKYWRHHVLRGAPAIFFPFQLIAWWHKANSWRRHHLPNCQRGLGEGRIELKLNSKPNPLVHISCALLKLRIGEAYGFKVALLFGRRLRSKRVGNGRQNFKKCTCYLKKNGVGQMKTERSHSNLAFWFATDWATHPRN